MHRQALALAVGFCALLAVPSRSPAAVTTTLFEHLKGFAIGTTGGQEGSVYVVDKTTDTNTGEALIEGTLRHAVNTATGPRWIKFDSTVFPLTTQVSIILKTPIYLKDNITIDGRGSHVLLRKRYSYADVDWTTYSNPARAECNVKPAPHVPAYDMGAILLLRSVKNVVITHIHFAKDYLNPEAIPSDLPALRDKQCFGDVIAIYNASTEQNTKYFDRIWINQSRFADCGDECIAITRSSSLTEGGVARKARITVSRNAFLNTYKGIVVGSGYEGMHKTELSLYLNRFYGIFERSPRAQDAKIHVFNNAYESWGPYGIGMVAYHTSAIQQNVFFAGAESYYPWRAYPIETGAPVIYPWSWGNKYYGVTNPTSYETTAPADPSAFYGYLTEGSGGTVENLDAMSFSTALQHIRDQADYREVANDVPNP